MNSLTLSITQYRIRIVVILLAAISPFICIFTYGYKPSISSCWNTDLQPLFIISNIATSYYMFTISKWRISAILLILVTAFSLVLFPNVHNILAVSFFLANIYPIISANRFKWCIWIYLTSALALPFSMTVAEIIAIGALCLYHILVLRKVYKITNN